MYWIQPCLVMRPICAWPGYISANTALKHIENICSQLRAFTEILGAGDKYNKTLTTAAIRAVNHFMPKSDAADFSDFISQYPRLKNNFKELMASHYNTDSCNSPLAKQQYMAPDLLPF